MLWASEFDQGAGLLPDGIQRSPRVGWQPTRQAGQLRSGSNIGGGQMVSADFTLSPSIQFSAKGTGGLKALAGGLFGSFGSVLGGG